MSKVSRLIVCDFFDKFFPFSEAKFAQKPENDENTKLKVSFSIRTTMQSIAINVHSNDTVDKIRFSAVTYKLIL